MPSGDYYGKSFSLVWKKLPADAFAELTEAYIREIEYRIFQIVKKWAPIIEAWMKDNAPWTDRTGNARAGLKANVFWIFGRWTRLELSHRVRYGTYLEGHNPETDSPMLNAGKWSIIEPALDEFKDKIWADIIAEFRT